MTAKQSTVKEELQPMKEIRYWVGKVLTPEQSEVEKETRTEALPQRTLAA